MWLRMANVLTVLAGRPCLPDRTAFSIQLSPEPMTAMTMAMHMVMTIAAIYGHIWPIYGHIWPCMAIYGPYMTIYGPYMVIYGHIWPYMGHTLPSCSHTYNHTYDVSMIMRGAPFPPHTHTYKYTYINKTPQYSYQDSYIQGF